MWRIVVVSIVILVLGCGTAFGESSVFIDSKTVGMGASATVGIYLANEASVSQITMPFVVREVTAGTYPTALSARYTADGRLPVTGPYLTGTSFLQYYDNEDGTCKNGQPGGFGTISGGGANLASFTVPAPSNPDGFLFARAAIIVGNLPAGSDGVIPSMAFDFSAPMIAGSFEIDTTCKNPSGHLLLVSGGIPLSVTFTKGTVDVIPCDCPYQADMDDSHLVGNLDFGWMVYALFQGGTDLQDPVCPTTRGDLDCDGFLTAMDLGYMIDYFWGGGPPPCDPCSEF